MELSWDVITDVALNATGYLAAGGLGVLLYSMFGGRRRGMQSTPVTAPAGHGAARSSLVQDGPRTGRRMQFLDLTSVPNAQPRDASDRRPLLEIAESLRRTQAPMDRPQDEN